jgi:hypothetical protein
MKNLLILLIFIFFIFTSCSKKADVVPVGTLSANIGGVNMNFNAYATYSSPASSKSNQLNIDGNINAPNSPGIGLSIAANGGAIGPGKYSVTDIANNPPFLVMLDYYIQPTGMGIKLYITDPNNVQPVKITITSISSTSVQGTFSSVLLEDQNRANTLSVTNGKFNVQIRR